MLYPRITLIAPCLFVIGICRSYGQYAPNEITAQDVLDRTTTIDVNNKVGAIGGSVGVSANGGAQYSIPIPVAPGSNGMAPSLALAYNTHAGDGVLGRGWSLTGVSAITRTGKDVLHDGVASEIRLSAADRFQLNGQRLVRRSGSDYGSNGAIYDTERLSYATIEQFGSAGNGPEYFTMITMDGTRMEFGNTADSRYIVDGTVVVWRLNKTQDPSGYYITYTYQEDGAETLLTRIDYTGNSLIGMQPFNAIQFHYTGRNDPSDHYVAGAVRSVQHLLDRIEVSAEGVIYNRYEINYALRDNNRSYLREITLFGDNGIDNFNTTIFKYGDLPVWGPDPLGDFTLQEYFAYPPYSDGSSWPATVMTKGDFDGDGRDELLASSFTTDEFWPNVQHFSEFKILKWNGSALSECTTVSVPDAAYIDPGNFVHSTHGAQFLVADYNGDGRSDVLTPIMGGPPAVGMRITYGGENCTFTSAEFPTPLFYYYPNLDGHFLVTGDFNADGLGDYVNFFRTYADAHDFRAFFSSPALSIINQEIGITGSSIEALTNAESLLTGDTDGDGASELVYLSGNTLSVFDISLDGIVLKSSQNSGLDNKRMSLADMDGDGKADLIGRESGSQSQWIVLYSTGETNPGPGTPAFQAFQFPQAHTAGDTHLWYPADLDGDGRTDFIHLTADYGGDAYMSIGGHGSFVPVHMYMWNNADWRAPATTLDLNGDGAQDLITFKTDLLFHLPTQVYFYRKDRHCGSLEATVDGMARLTRFEYASLAQETNPVHTLGSDHTYPIINAQPPLEVVRLMETSNGIGGLKGTKYEYQGAFVGMKSRGFLGFKEIASATQGPDLQQEFYSYRETSPKESIQGLIPDHTNDYTFDWTKQTTTHTQVVGSVQDGFDLRITSQQAHEWPTDAITTLTNSEWNSCGLVTRSALNVDGIENIETTTSYMAAGPSVASCKPRLVSVQKTRTGQPPALAETRYEYNSGSGSLWKKTGFNGTQFPVTTEYEYYFSGALRTMRTTYAGGGPNDERTSRFEYDNKIRFIERTESKWLAPDGAEHWIASEAEYSSSWGKPFRTLSTDGLTTLFDFDHFGRLSSMQVPHIAGQLRYAVTLQRDWVPGMPSHQVYSERIEDPANPETETRFDQLGRPVWASIETVSHGLSETSKEYDENGLLVRTVAPHIQGEEEVITEYEYNGPRRQLTSTTNNVSGPSSIEYDHDLHNLVTTTTNAAGQSRTSTVDPTGKPLSVKDDGGVLRYIYDSWGNEVSINHGSLGVMTAGYDEYGRQKSLEVPGAGTTYFHYDPFGQLSQQVDGNGNTTSSKYDMLGRLVYREGDEGETTYEYFFDGQRFSSAPARIVGLDGDFSFEYDDPYNRLTAVRKTIGGEEFTTSHTYDQYDRLVDMQYPSGVSIDRSYDSEGFLVDVLHNGTSLFHSGSMNGQGQYLDYTYGDGAQTTITREYGFPTRVSAFRGNTEVFDLHMNFDFPAGTLSARWDGLAHKKERFEYDALNRLVGTTLYEVDNDGHETAGYGTSANTYDGEIGIHTKGNIIRKADVGKIFSTGHQPTGAVGFDFPVPPDAPPLNISLQPQHIEYTPFSQPMNIGEAIGGLDHKLQFYYGPDLQRTRSERLIAGDLCETRVYVGGYERQTLTNKNLTTTNEIHYVPGGDGLCAIIIKNNEIETVHYVYKDHLGSILKLTHVNGQLLETTALQSFDPWGNPRNPATWQSGNIPVQPFWLYRGFTGHEHLATFGLINMNGRLQDPVLGRMLKPDKYVANSGSTQAFNRYSYVGNSPTNMVDPDGQLGWLAITAISSLVGGYAGGVIESGEWDFGKWDEQAWQAAGVGAMAGAFAGTQISAGVGSDIIPNSGGAVSKGFSLTSTILNGSASRMLETARHNGSLESVFRSGVSGLTTSGFAATGGLGIVKTGFAGRLAYQGIGSALGSIGDNWAAGDGLFSKVTWGVGPVNLTLGRGQALFQYANNKGNIFVNGFGLANLAAGGGVSWNWKHLTAIYEKGLMDTKLFGGSWGAHAVLYKHDPDAPDPSSFKAQTLSHEFHHVWQSRALGDSYLMNYGFAGLTSSLIDGSKQGWHGHDLRGFAGYRNFFESQAYAGAWW